MNPWRQSGAHPVRGDDVDVISRGRPVVPSLREVDPIILERTIASAHPRRRRSGRSTAARYRSEKLFWPHHMSYRFYVAAASWSRCDPGATIDLVRRTARSNGPTSQPLRAAPSALERILIESHAPRRPFLLASVYVISFCTDTHAPQSLYFRSVDIRVLPDRL